MNLGETIKNLRIARHWTQDELAYRAKITAANISRIETGKHGPSTQLLESLACVFGMKMYQLVALAEGEKLPVAPPEYDFTEQALLQNFRAMTPKEQELFMALGERLASAGESA
ncbi:MAG: helix-turn-helix transcriptional regulator [Nitrosomonadales bacterium]|nr:helix-turn-helix transcriptional regulator [Nitrosomonadales bacterium]